MNKPDVKKLVLLNLPYVFAFYFADKIAAVFRLAPGTEFIGKLTNGFAVFGTAFANPPQLSSRRSAHRSVGWRVLPSWRSTSKARTARSSGRANNTDLHDGVPEDIKPYIPGVLEQRHSDADGVPDHEQPPKAAEIRPQQKYRCHRRFRLRQTRFLSNQT